MDTCCFQGHHSASKPIKEYQWDHRSLPFCPKETRTIPLPSFKWVETLTRPRGDQQKDKRDKNCCNCGSNGSGPWGSTLATRVNTTATPARNNCDRNWSTQQEDKNLSQTTCYNYNKKAILPINALRPASSKTSIGLGDLFVGDWC